MKLDIVTHVFAGKMDQYWQALCIHLSAAVLARREWGSGGFRVVVCTADRRRHDRKTFAVLDHFREHYFGEQWIEQMRLPLGELFRRSIGRNRVAKATTADAVIFTDVDYIWTAPAMQGLVRHYDPSQPISFSRNVWMHHDPANGDALLRSITAPGFVAPWDGDPMTRADKTPGGWFCRHEKRGIGGNQIVSGDHCRKYGYLHHHAKFQTPTTETTIPFANFRDDMTFRGHAGQTIGISGRKRNGRKREYYGSPLPLDGVLRIRHVDAPYKLVNSSPATIIENEQPTKEAVE